MATTVNISSYSGSVSAGNWSPALLAAYNDIKTTGGTIVFDVNTTLKTGVDMTSTGANVALNFVGDGGTKCTIDSTNAHALFYLGNKTHVKFSNMVFIGRTGTSATPDCSVLIYAGYVEKLTVENCLFAGIVGDPSIITAATGQTNVCIKNNRFGGCGASTAHILINGADSADLEDNQFYDYQHFAGSYYDRQATRPQWVKGQSPPPSVTVSTGFISIKGCVFDEGADHSVTIEDYPHVVIENCRSNLNSAVTSVGIALDTVENATINNCWMGYHTDPRPAVHLTDCGGVNINGLKTQGAAHTVTVDSKTSLTLTNSPEVTLALI